MLMRMRLRIGRVSFCKASPEMVLFFLINTLCMYSATDILFLGVGEGCLSSAHMENMLHAVPQ